MELGDLEEDGLYLLGAQHGLGGGGSGPQGLHGLRGQGESQAIRYQGCRMNAVQTGTRYEVKLWSITHHQDGFRGRDSIYKAATHFFLNL